MFHPNEMPEIMESVKTLINSALFCLLLLSCADQNKGSVGNLCDASNPIAGVWVLQNVQIDEAGYDSVSDEAGNLEINCNGSYTEAYSFVVEGITLRYSETGEWTQSAEDTLVFSDRNITWKNTLLNARKATFVTLDFDSSTTLSQETTRLEFKKAN